MFMGALKTYRGGGEAVPETGLGGPRMAEGGFP